MCKNFSLKGQIFYEATFELHFHEILNQILYYLYVKLKYSEKATKFCEISTLLLSYVVPVKSKVEILQNFVAFLEYMNFTQHFGFFF